MNEIKRNPHPLPAIEDQSIFEDPFKEMMLNLQYMLASDRGHFVAANFSLATVHVFSSVRSGLFP